MTLEARLDVALRRSRLVRDCVVLSRGGAPSAFVELALPSTLDARAVTRERLWAMVFDRASASGAWAGDPSLHFGTWKDSYTGQLYSEATIRGNVEATVARVLARGPKRVMEIGCATGMLLLRIAPHCERYVGTDIAERGLEHIRAQLSMRPELAARVTLLQRSALDFDGYDEGAFDSVVIDSVVQYFPSSEYLVEVIRRAARVTARGGHIFLGELRSAALHGAFLALVEAHTAADGDSAEAIRARVKKASLVEKELLVDPAFVLPLIREVPEITEARVRLRRGACRTELTSFRYDVELTVNGPVRAPAPLRWIEWGRAGETLEGLRGTLARAGDEPLAFRAIPNARLVAASRALAWIENSDPTATGSELRRLITSGDESRAVDPEALFQLATGSALEAHVGWSDTEATGDACVVFAPRGSDPRFLGIATPPRHAELYPVSRFAREPMHKSSLDAALGEIADLAREAAPEARTVIVHLGRLPRDARGDLDRGVLEELL